MSKAEEAGYQLNDRVEILLHARSGYYGPDTGGGWTSDWVSGKIVKINPINVVVLTDHVYFSFFHSVPLRRMRREAKP